MFSFNFAFLGYTLLAQLLSCRLVEYVAIGPRFSNIISQTLMVLLKRLPPLVCLMKLHALRIGPFREILIFLKICTILHVAYLCFSARFLACVPVHLFVGQ